MLAGLAAAATMVALAPAPRAAEPSAADRAALIARAEAWLNGIGTLKARFLQAAQDGEVSEGTLYLSRPGNLRLDYDPPSPVQVYARDGALVYYDSKLKQVSYVDLDSTLAGVLISSQVKLDSGRLRVVRVGQSPGVLSVTVTRRDDPRQGQITLDFTQAPFALRQWQVVDAQGATTSVSLYEPQVGVTLDDRLFQFVDPRAPASRTRGGGG